MSGPKYRAYKTATVTDGIWRWVRATFDCTVRWTPDDEKKFIDGMSHLSPNARIAAMKANLDGLQNVTPPIKMHADAIRGIHADFKKSGSTYEGLQNLQKADALWEKIRLLRDVIPLARMGKDFSGVQSIKGGKSRPRIDVDGEKYSMRDIVKGLASKTDELGDLLPARELWDELFSQLDEMHLSPKVSTVPVEEIAYGKKGYKIKFDSFKVMLSDIRKEAKKS